MKTQNTQNTFLSSFLESKGASNEFIGNCVREIHNCQRLEELEELKEKLNNIIQVSIANILSWQLTPEGKKYWKILHNEFINLPNVVYDMDYIIGFLKKEVIKKMGIIVNTMIENTNKIYTKEDITKLFLTEEELNDIFVRIGVDINNTSDESDTSDTSDELDGNTSNVTTEQTEKYIITRITDGTIVNGIPIIFNSMKEAEDKIQEISNKVKYIDSEFVISKFIKSYKVKIVTEENI